MGSYVNKTTRGFLGKSSGEKCDGILSDGGKEITTPKVFVRNLVVVVDNGHFGAAKYVDTIRDLEMCKQPDGRAKRWFVWDKVEYYAE
jgi:hypothetical protein